LAPFLAVAPPAAYRRSDPSSPAIHSDPHRSVPATFRRPLLAFLAALLPPVSVSGQSGTISAALPASPDAHASYLIYLHGRIIEVQGRRPSHPQFGVYEYDAILEGFAARGFQVVSEARPADTQVEAYARHVADQVRTLLDAGVPAERIAVVGFSKGGMIAVAASSVLWVPGVRYAILAGCNQSVFDDADLTLTGRVLSIHEASDDIGVSCAPLIGRSPDADATERRIDTGERHGAFYRPIDAWLDPLFAWLEGRDP